MAEGELDAQWILEAAAAAYEGALIKTIGRMAYTRRLMLAVVHGIGAPSLGRCEAAVAAWSTGTRRSRRAAALSALAG